MIRFIYSFILILVIYSCGNKDQTENIPTPDNHTEFKHEHVSVIDSLMDSLQLNGTVLVYDAHSNTYFSNDFERARTGFLPASTFKIPNSIIGLETGVIENEDMIFKWNGEKRNMAIWEKDMNLREAYQNSCVPCYQEVARGIGMDSMNHYLEAFDYARMEVKEDNMDVFWLEGASRISAFEQIRFLRKLQERTLDISTPTYEIMEKVMLIDQKGDYILKGKTGWSIRDGWNVGWFVGIIDKGDKVYYVATNVEPKENFDMNQFARVRFHVTRLSLQKMGIID